VAPSEFDSEGLVELGTTLSIRKSNPHGPGAQWKNCSSCHPQ
jgi:hypothetical protein